MTGRRARLDERLNEAHRLLVSAVEGLASSDDWLAVLDMSRRLPSYSPRNCLLLVAQNAQGMTMGYKSWSWVPAQGGGHCQVRRGATALKILAPVTALDEATEQERTARRLVGFRVASVFDEAALVSPPAWPDPATLAPAVLDGAAPERLWDALAAQVGAAGYLLIDDEATATSIAPANGLTDPQARTVTVRPDLPAAQRAKSLAHELGHVLLHDPRRLPDGLSRDVAEVEAESVAYLVAGELGLDTTAYTIPYVAGWSSGQADLVLATAQRCVDTARRVTEEVGRFLGRDSPAPEAPDLPDADRAAEAASSATTPQMYADLPDGPLPGHPAEPGPPASSPAGGPAASIATPSGRWELGWDAPLGTFHARHQPATPENAPASTWLGAEPVAIPTVGALEERLGFPLPAGIRERLAADQRVTPAASQPARDFAFLDDADPSAGARVVGVPPEERPDPASAVRVAGAPDTTYAAALRDDPRPPRVWEDAGFRLELLHAALRVAGDSAPPAQDVTYRLTHQGTVMFSGDDVTAPADADVTSDDAVRAVLTVLCRTEPDVHLTPAQTAFLAEHALDLAALVAVADPPYEPGTRVSVTRPDATGQLTGVVTEALADLTGEVTAYAWRPDAADLPGHPWHDNPRHALITSADRVTPTLAGPENGLAGWPASEPPGFGATVVLSADDGEQVTGVVQRTIAGPGGLACDVAPDMPGTEQVRVLATGLDPVAGTAWPSLEHLLVARAAAGVPLHPGEVLSAGGQTRQVVQGPDGPVLTDRDTPSPAELGPMPVHPGTTTVEQRGELTRIGDPHHGWLTVPTELFAAAMRLPDDVLASHLRSGAAGLYLNEREARVTLAALAALHTPDVLATPSARLSGPAGGVEAAL